MSIHDFLQRTILDNTLEDICWFVGIIIVGFLFQKLLSRLLTLFVFKFLQRYAQGVGYDKLLVLLKRPMGVLVILISVYIGMNYLHFPDEWKIASMQQFGIRLVLYRLFQ